MKLSEVIPQFLNEADVQEPSRRMYEICIRKFFIWAHANKLDPEKLNRAHIIRYKAELQASDLTTATVKNYLTVVRIFYRWASQNNIHDDIVAGIRSPKYDQSYKRYPLTTDQVKELLRSVDRSRITGARDYAIISLMIYNGMRRIEVEGIDIRDIVNDQGKQGIHIKGKGRSEKDQFVKITNTTMEAIHDYMLMRSSYDEKDPLFISTHGRTHGARISKLTITKMVKVRLRAIGIDSKYYTCHSLRHTAACLLIDAGFDLHKVQLFMRHKSPSTTTLYTRIVDEQLRLRNEAGEALEKLIQTDHNSDTAKINK